MTDPYTALSSLLSVDVSTLRALEARLSAASGVRDGFAAVALELDDLLRERLSHLALPPSSGAEAVRDALLAVANTHDGLLSRALGSPRLTDHEDCVALGETLHGVSGRRRGFFLRHEVARSFLEAVPPRRILAYLGSGSVSEMLEREDLLEVFSALRFIEGSEWLNTSFFPQYAALTPSDFEERDVVVRALSPVWRDAAEAFVKKKWHNISHLKELGVVFIIPASLGVPGEMLRTASLVFHYLHEVPFYSDLFRAFSSEPVVFAERLTSLLRGDVLSEPPSASSASVWLVVQRYLAKDDPADWRLFTPRINPEALHWMKVEKDMVALARRVDGEELDTSFWRGTGPLGAFFPTASGGEELVSFDLVDTVMSLVKRPESIKYLYHQREALWNYLFAAHFGYEGVEEFSRRHLLRGFFEV